MVEPALTVRTLHAGYGETVVLEDLTFSIGLGESTSIIGRNGVGKTTLLTTIMGHTTCHSGEIILLDRDITRVRPFRRARAGLALVPQEREIFSSLSVEDNLKVAARPGPWTATQVYDLFPQLSNRRSNRGNQLSGGEQQMLAIGRALMGNPRILLLDEPSEGLAPVIVEQLQTVMARLRDDSGMTIVLVEQNSRIALAFAPRCIVMNRGRIIYYGPSTALRDDPEKLEELVGVG